MIKNFFFVETLEKNTGWGTLTLNYLRKFNKKNVIIFCVKKNIKYKFKQIEILPEVLELIKNPFLVYFTFKKVNKILIKFKKKNIKLISHFTVEPYVLLLAFEQLFYKNIYYAIGTYSTVLKNNLSTNFIFKLAIKKISNLIYFSSYTKKKLSAIIDLKKIENNIIVNPVIYPKKYRKYNFKKYSKLTLISVGMLKARKGYHNLIEVMNILINKYNQDINLCIVGKKSSEGNYFNFLSSKIKDYNLSKFIEIKTNVGAIELDKIYKKSHMFVLLSEDQKDYFEGFGIVYLEALSFNLPVVFSNKTGAIDLKNVDNLLNFFNPKDYVSIAKYIKNFFKKKFKYNNCKNVKILERHNRLNDLKITNFYKKEILL
jgi:glycosyltransferase involved in cell wall biosynthesis